MTHGSPVQVFCLGETMLMLAPPGRELIEHSCNFRVYIGGSEANVAVGLARLGVRAGWVGKLPRNALGRKVVNGIRAYGVETSAVVWADAGRVGTFYVEWGAAPRPTRTLYDRAHSAATTLTVDDLDWARLAQAAWLHLTGITPALSETCRRNVPAIVRRARELGLKVAFDVNYRSLLWSPEAAREACAAVLPHVNLVIATANDAAMLLDAPSDSAPAALAQQLFAVHRPDAVVITCGGEGSVAFDGTCVQRAATWAPEVVNRIGAGDAFDAGLLYGVLHGDLALGLRYGNAMAALKMTIPQNLPLVRREDVERLLSGEPPRLVR